MITPGHVNMFVVVATKLTLSVDQLVEIPAKFIEILKYAHYNVFRVRFFILFLYLKKVQNSL